MKKLILISSAILLICLLVGCNLQSDEKGVANITDEINITEITDETEIAEITDDTDLTDLQATEEINIGGSVPDTEFTNSFILLSGTLSNSIDMNRLPEWKT